jgi:CRP-like cAMP-binding protein
MSLTQALKQADLFFDLGTVQLELIANVAYTQTCHTGDVIFEENTAGSELYIIAEGEVLIQLDPRVLDPQHKGDPQTLATLRKGQSFGEISLVDDGGRSARAICARDNTRLVVIPREPLMKQCQTFPQMGYKIMRNLALDLALKLRNTDTQFREFFVYTPQSET